VHITISGSDLHRCPQFLKRQTFGVENGYLLRDDLPYVKKTPFFSCPTETRFLLGSGTSDWNSKPASFADRLIVAPVLRNEPNGCTSSLR
jgi:hypothetical protein